MYKNKHKKEASSHGTSVWVGTPCTYQDRLYMRKSFFVSGEGVPHALAALCFDRALAW